MACGWGISWIRVLPPNILSCGLKHQRLLDGLNFHEDISEWEEEFFEALDFMRQFKIVNGEYFINDKIQQGKKVLAEGAQGSMLDVDFGTFPLLRPPIPFRPGFVRAWVLLPSKSGMSLA